jgi:hypothetical protein
MTHSKRLAPKLILSLALPASVSYAQAPPDEPPPAERAAAVQPWSAGIGIGFVAFTGERADDSADIGLSYEVRGGYQATDLLRLEAAYIGSMQSITALGLDEDASIRSNGVETLARIEFERWVSADVGGMQVAPFGFGGLAFQRFSIADEGIGTADIADDDNVFSVPLGAGISGTAGRFNTDARFTWRSTFDEDLFRDPNGDNADASLSHWSVTARAGLMF